MFVFYKHDKSSIYEENAIHYPYGAVCVRQFLLQKRRNACRNICRQRNTHKKN